MYYKLLRFPVPNFKRLLANRSVVPSPLSYIRQTMKGITLKPKQKYVKSIILIITKIVSYNFKVSDWHLFLDNEASSV